MQPTKKISQKNTRRLIPILAAIITAITFAGCSPGQASAETPITLASYQRGFSVVLTERISENTTAEDQLEVTNYSDLQQLYTDMLSGEVDMTIGSPDVFAQQAAQGAPLHIAATVSPNSTAVVGRERIESADDLIDKRVAAVTSSGGWNLTAATFEEEFGLVAGADYEVVNVQDMASGTSQVVAGTADYVVGWEPSVNQALEASDQLTIAFSTAQAQEGETYGDGWQLVLAVRNDVDQELIDEAVVLITEAAEELNAAPDEADAYAVEFGFEPGTASSVMDQSVPAYVVQPLDDEIRQELKEQIQRVIEMSDDGKEPPESFYGVGK